MARLIEGDNVLERVDRIAQGLGQQGNYYEANLVLAVVRSILASEPSAPIILGGSV